MSHVNLNIPRSWLRGSPPFRKVFEIDFCDTPQLAAGSFIDYWHLVEYAQLLDSYQKYVHLAITGAMAPQEALDKVAGQHQALLQNAQSQAPATAQ